MGCTSLACINEKYVSLIKKPIDTNILAPWVECWIDNIDGKPAKRITVGNKSNPPNNTAVIKSFQFGSSNGCGCNIEIFDEEGGNFVRFFNKMTIGGNDIKGKYVLGFRWGWQKKDCDGTTSGFEQKCCPGQGESLASCPHTLLVTNITVRYARNGYHFIVEGSDVINNLQEIKSTGSQGSSKNQVYLVEAVKKLFEPYNVDVKFWKISEGCNAPTNMIFVENGENGPKSIGTAYQGSGRPVLEVALNWVFSALPANPNTGIQVFFDSTQVRPTLVFLEADTSDLAIGCNIFKNTRYSLGTYIVGGGSCSPVIEFTPNIKWSAAMAYYNTIASVDSAGGPTRQSGPSLDCGRIGDVYKGAGASASTTTKTMDIYRDWERAQLEAVKKIKTHGRANINWSAIKADLKIQGDPSFSNPVLWMGKFVSIVVMNPYHLGGSNNSPQWQYLAGEPCNRVLSNKNWMINGGGGGGVFHDIREGSYTTTLKLVLAAPGMDPLNISGG